MAKKIKKIFICDSCGQEEKNWLGKCPGCGEWDTLKEFVEPTQSRGIGSDSKPGSKAISLNDINISATRRLLTGNQEFDRTLGGGFAPSSLVLIGGDPGIGKSTLLLQTATNMQTAGISTLYITGEESAEQIKLRADRLNVGNSDLTILCETDILRIFDAVKKLNPDIIIVDSIQTIYKEAVSGAPGSASQIRECTLDLMVFTKSFGCITILIGHVTKDGQIAGPKILEHMVDAVVYFEGDINSHYRILRSIKNRFGATNEIGVLEMTNLGLTPVANPSGFFIQENTLNTPGSSVCCTQEGSRSLLFEIQALVNTSNYAVPQKVSMGIDGKRITIILAILEKFAGVTIGNSDVFVQVAGGLKIDDTTSDLALAFAISCNHLNKSIEGKVIIMGELGLSGEVRRVNQLEVRLKEAKRLGFDTAIVPTSNKKVTISGMTIHTIDHIKNLLDFIEQ
ncbi:MAG: DNA repair protein RadA [Fibrobacterales bacterium]